jgi:hypothetical protein
MLAKTKSSACFIATKVFIIFFVFRILNKDKVLK